MYCSLGEEGNMQIIEGVFWKYLYKFW